MDHPAQEGRRRQTLGGNRRSRSRRPVRRLRAGCGAGELEERKRKEVEEQKRAKEAAHLEAECQAKLMADEEEKKRLEDKEEARRMEEAKKQEEMNIRFQLAVQQLAERRKAILPPPL